MSRNLLKNSYGSPYRWTSSDAKSQVNLDTPGQATNLSTAYTNAYLWLYNVPNAEYQLTYAPIHDLVQDCDTLTLSVDIKVTGDAAHTSARMDVRYNNEEGKTITDWIDEGTTGQGTILTGVTDWTRIHLKVKTTNTGKNGTAALFCIFFHPGCAAGTTVQWRNMKLEVGDTGSEWTPAPEEVLFTSLAPGDTEQGVIGWGPSSARKTYQEMKMDDNPYFHARVRTTDLIPLLGRSVFCIDVSESLRVIPYYFDSDGLSLGTDDSNWRTGMQTYTVPSGAAYVAIYFSNAESTEITPEDVTNVTGGGVLTDDH